MQVSWFDSSRDRFETQWRGFPRMATLLGMVAIALMGGLCILPAWWDWKQRKGVKS